MRSEVVFAAEHLWKISELEITLSGILLGFSVVFAGRTNSRWRRLLAGIAALFFAASIIAGFLHMGWVVEYALTHRLGPQMKDGRSDLVEAFGYQSFILLGGFFLVSIAVLLSLIDSKSTEFRQ